MGTGARQGHVRPHLSILHTWRDTHVPKGVLTLHATPCQGWGLKWAAWSSASMESWTPAVRSYFMQAPPWGTEKAWFQLGWGSCIGQFARGAHCPGTVFHLCLDSGMTVPA